MARAYLKIFLNTNDEDRVLKEISEVQGVKSADLTMGDQDIIAIVESDTCDDIVQIVIGQIRRINGIERTVTNLAVS